MIAKDEGGDLLYSGLSTMCSYSPPPRAPAMEKHRRINTHYAKVTVIYVSHSLSIVLILVLKSQCGIFAGIGCALLCAVVQYATSIP